MDRKELLKKIYTDPKNPACFASVLSVLQEAKKTDAGIKKKDVEAFMETQDTYTLHKPKRRHFPRNRVVAIAIDSHWQANLCDMQALRKYNDGIGYLLTVIDVLSKYSWAVPVKTKQPSDVKDAFSTILKSSGRLPVNLFTDKGKEFVGKPFQEYLKEKNISYATSQNPDIKASVAERYNRTLKTRIWKYLSENNTNRYIDDLQSIVDSINASYHRMIKRRPIDVNFKNENEVYETLYGSLQPPPVSFRFSIGDKVHITKEKHIFEKGYLPNFTQEIFEIHKRVARNPPVYRLKDYNGEEVEGVFYEHELVKVIKEDDAEYKIEKILKKRTRRGVKEVFVKWMGYPSSFNQWIPEKEVRMLKV